MTGDVGAPGQHHERARPLGRPPCTSWERGADQLAGGPRSLLRRRQSAVRCKGPGGRPLRGCSEPRGRPPPPGCCAGVGVDRAPQARGGPGWQKACPRGLCGDTGEVGRLWGVTASRAQRPGSAALVPAHTRRGAGRALTLGEVRARVSQARCPIGTDWPKASGTDTPRRRRGHPSSAHSRHGHLRPLSLS